MKQDAGIQPIPGLERILIVKLADLGDAVLAIPAVTAIRDAYATARVDVLTTPIGAEGLAMCPSINRLITFPKNLFDRPVGLLKPANGSTLVRLGWRLRRGRYDAVVLLHHLTTSFGSTKFQALARATGARVVAGLDNGRGSFLTHRATDFGFGERAEWEYGLATAETIGGRRSPGVDLVIPDSARLRAHALLESHEISHPFIVIHPGVGPFSPARRWPIERFAEVARSLRHEVQVSIVVVGTREERPEALPLLSEPGVIDLMGETSIASLAAVLSGSSLVVGADSAICHLGAAVGVPTISIFGPSNHRAWSPIGVPANQTKDPKARANHVVLRSGIPCSPCFYVGYGLGRLNGCPLRTCLQQVTAKQVFETARSVLAQGQSGSEPEGLAFTMTDLN